MIYKLTYLHNLDRFIKIVKHNKFFKKKKQNRIIDILKNNKTDFLKNDGRFGWDELHIGDLIFLTDHVANWIKELPHDDGDYRYMKATPEEEKMFYLRRKLREL